MEYIWQRLAEVIAMFR